MKRKKVTKQRGGKTHGWGSMKKHRGAGNRGGRGNAGSGKRADQKKPSYWNPRKPNGQKYGKDYFGKSGFHSIHDDKIAVINVRDLDMHIASWVTEKHATKSGEAYTIDLSVVGVLKILGSGQITKKVKVTVAHATAGAIEKISAVGGEVIVTVADKSSDAESKE